MAEESFEGKVEKRNDQGNDACAFFPLNDSFFPTP